MKTELINALEALGLYIGETWSMDSDDGTKAGILIRCLMEYPIDSMQDERDFFEKLMSPRHELDQWYLGRAEEALETGSHAKAVQHALNAHLAVQFQGTGHNVAPGAWYFETPFIELRSDCEYTLYFELTARGALNV